MRLRARFAEEIKTRLLALLPEAVVTAWDGMAVVVAVEKITFTSTGGIEDGWDRKARLEGVVRVELRADVVDAQEVEPLIADLLSRSVFLDYATDPAIGQMSERGRFKLAEWRDTLRDSQLVSSLRFTVSGSLAVYAGPSQRPDLMVSQAPLVGSDHEGDYSSIMGAAA